MIRVERDPQWWTTVAEHPAVAETLMGGDPSVVGLVVQNPAIVPLAAENGGFFFTPIDTLRLVWEFHTLFRPEGWGREVYSAAVEACVWMFSTAQTLVTYELADNPRSQPPRSFGFVMAADFQEASSLVGPIRARSWMLTRAAWLASPAYTRFRRKTCQ